MNRREFVMAIGGALAAPLARAQKASKVPVLGILTPQPRPAPAQRAQNPFMVRLKKLGWVDGETLVIEQPDGREDRLSAMAEELVRKQVDVIWATGPEAAVAAARATRTIPIVFWGVAWPIEQGLIDSFARPGRNVTGMAFSVGTEWQKVLEALREIAPKALRLAAVATPSANRTVSGELFQSSVARNSELVKQIGFEFQRFEVARVEDFEGVFAAIRDWRAQALYVPGTTLTFRERKRFADFATQHHFPSAFNQREFVDAGGLFSYGIDSLETTLQALGHVDRILRGAKPAELPVVLPSKYEFVVNQKTANALGLKIPQSILVRADRVIE
jgi:putative ABC transport system substrate-binding protein